MHYGCYACIAMLSIMLNHVVYTLAWYTLMASSQFEGSANADGATVANIELTQLTQLTIVEKLTPPTKLDLTHKRKIEKPNNTGAVTSCYSVIM